MTDDIEIHPRPIIETLPTLLAALRQPGPHRDVVRAEVVREAIASGTIVETYPGKNAPYWRLPDMLEKAGKAAPR